MSIRGQDTLRAGDLLAGRYRIGELLGEGGYGRVFRAVQLPLEREVAIKIVNARDPELAARFVREAEIIRSLEHPNTVRVLDMGTTPEGEPFLVLELLRGQDLDQLLERGPLSVDVALEITEQVLRSLAEAHDKGIVHRDIKPGNVFITSHFGEPTFVKVLDFGIAKQLRSGEKLTAIGETLGTPSYMPPEQAMGLPIDARTDLYAVGLMLAELVTGKLVFGKGGPLTIVAAQAGLAPVPLGTDVTDSPVGPIVVRAVKKDPSERYQSAVAMLLDVEATRRSLARIPAAPEPAAHVTAMQGTAAQLTAAQPTAVQPTAVQPTAVQRTAVQGTVAGFISAAPPNATIAAPIAIPRGPTTIATSHDGRRQRALIIAMGAIIAVLTTALVVLLVYRGDEPKAREKTDDPESDSEEPRSRRPVREVKPPVKGPKARTTQELKRAFTDAGYTLTSAQTGSEDVEVYSFNVEKDVCTGTVVRIASVDESIAQAQAKSVLKTPGCQAVVTGTVLVYACLVRTGVSGVNQECGAAAAKLMAK